jgi:hypothetical protein
MSTKTSRRNFLRTAISIAAAFPCCNSDGLAGVRSLGLPLVFDPELTASTEREGAIEFESSDKKLVDGFLWAKKQALVYARIDGSIGPWYEAALPGRDAFCMRDVSHQSTGAQFLGLGPRTLNMLRRFAANLSASKKWCTWWEITREGLPAPVDYANDSDFWYDLPASFDVVDACYRQWLWSRNDAYVDEVFLNYYEHTLTDYVKTWDRQGNGLLEHLSSDGHMGIGTYDEDLQSQILVGADLVAAQYAAYGAYASILKAIARPNAGEFEEKANRLKTLYNNRWWDAAHERYFGAIEEDGKFHADLKEGDGRCTLELPLHYGLTDAGRKTDAALDILEKRLETDLTAPSGVIGGVEGRSYMPDIFYRYGRSRAGYSALTALMDPGLKRREYPEVSYTVIGNLSAGLMGIRPLSGANAIATLPQLTHETSWAALHHAPVGRNMIALRHNAPSASAAPAASSTLTNERGPEIRWHAGFAVKSADFLVNGKKIAGQTTTRSNGLEESYCEIQVRPGETCTVSVPTG